MDEELMNEDQMSFLVEEATIGLIGEIMARNLAALEFATVTVKGIGKHGIDVTKPIHLQLDNTLEDILRRIEGEFGSQVKGHITITFEPTEIEKRGTK